MPMGREDANVGGPALLANSNQPRWRPKTLLAISAVHEQPCTSAERAPGFLKVRQEAILNVVGHP